VIDDIGMVPAGQDAADALYASTPPTNAVPSSSLATCTHPGSTRSCPRTLANATVDRLLYHAHFVLAEGGSQRLAGAFNGTGVKPLS
jgi:hypothetical protein